MFSKYFNRHLEPSTASRPGVEPVCDGVQALPDYAPTGPFPPRCKYSRIQAIGVFICCRAPRGCVGQQSTPERPCARSALYLLLSSLCLIIRQGFAANDGFPEWLSMAVSASSAERARWRLASWPTSPAGWCALDQRGNGRAGCRRLDQDPPPGVGNQAALYLRRALDADHIRQAAAPPSSPYCVCAGRHGPAQAADPGLYAAHRAAMA